MLRNRATTLASGPPRHQEIESCASNALIIESRMLKKAIILGRQESLYDNIRDLFIDDRRATFFTDLRHQSPIARVDAQRRLQFDVAHGFGRRETGAQKVVCSGDYRNYADQPNSG